MSLRRKILVELFMIIVRIVVNSYTIITLPVYFLCQKPWKARNKANLIRSVKENSDDINSAWIRNAKDVEHFVLKSDTITETLRNVTAVYKNSGRTCLGYREVISEDDIFEKNGNVKRVDGRTLKKYKLSEYKWLTYDEVDEITTNIAKGLTSIGINFGDKVLIFAETRVEWFLSAQAVMKLGATIVTLFSNLGDDGIIYGINQTEIQVMITTRDLMPKVKSLMSKTPSISTIICMNTLDRNAVNFGQNIKLMTLKDVEKAGKHLKHKEFRTPRPDDPLIIMYTSGTTGTPKAAIASHKQIIASFKAIISLVKDIIEEAHIHTYIAFLPLAHVLELTIEIFLFHGGVKIGYATPFTLTDTSPGLARGQQCDIKLLKPTVMTTVPLVLDRISKEIYNKLKARTPISVDIFNFLMDYKIKWTQKGYKTGIVNKLLCSKVREQMGGQMKIMIVGGAPLNSSTQALIKAALDVTLIQGYGATETTGAVLCMDFNDLSYGKVGAPLQGVKVKLLDWDEGGYSCGDKPNPRGEILIGGNIVAMGYFKLPEQTREAFKKDKHGVQWFHTGDIGEMFPDGTFKIIDRKKDLIKLQNGEYVSLGKIEAALKSCEYVDNICVCGGGLSNDLVALVIPNIIPFKQLAKEMGKQDLPLKKLCEDSEINRKVYASVVQSGVASKLNKKEIPIRILLVPDEWSPDNEMLTAAMKLKRRNVETKYKKEINSLFSSDYSIANNNKSFNDINANKV